MKQYVFQKEVERCLTEGHAEINREFYHVPVTMKELMPILEVLARTKRVYPHIAIQNGNDDQTRRALDGAVLK